MGIPSAASRIGQRKGHDHVGVVQLRSLTGNLDLRLVVGVSLQVVLLDQESSHRAADQGAHHVAQRTGSNTNGGCIRSAVALEDRAQGGSGAHAAAHGSGGALQAQQGFRPMT